MPRKARDDRLDTRTARLKLAVRREPYWRNIQEGRALGYRRLPGGKAGTWIARRYDADEGRTYRALGSADDFMDADGANTLTFAQAQARAADWFREIERNAGRLAEPITVIEAMEHYLADYLARGGKAERDVRTTINAHILPALGERRVADLSLGTIRAWHHQLAAAPARLRTGEKAKRANVRQAEGSEGRRARRSSANRVLTVLKAALSLAYREGRVPSDDAWRRVKPFANVDAPRIRYLTDEEAVRLVNACPPDLRALVVAALLTACRYGELARLRAGDLDAEAGVLHIGEAKGGKPRTVPLTDEATRHFLAVATGKPGTALLLTRADGGSWGESHQHRPLQDACDAARIAPAVSFHILRHTYASRLVQRGVPMAVIAAALGNTEAICAKHYAHLSPSYIADSIRQAAGELGIVPREEKVKRLRREGAAS
jgi:integrase